MKLSSKLKHVDSLFMNGGEQGIEAYREAVQAAAAALEDEWKGKTKPYSGNMPRDLHHNIKELCSFQKTGEPLEHVLDELKNGFLPHRIHVEHPTCIAHLHCPPLIPALVAEMLISVLNLSMDSFDQSGAASLIEEEMVQWLCRKFRYGKEADGTFTSGGTQSNHMGLLLARDAFCEKKWNWDVQKDGLPPEAGRLRILCSKDAHFTVKKSASQLGLGERAVVLVETDGNKRMCLRDLKKKTEMLDESGLYPFALVATCGTTDFGSIDPLQELADAADAGAMWLHVDAAYGGALIMSKTRRDRLAGIERADSISVDFHKQFYQPVSCGAFLIKDGRNFRFIDHHADYLNPEEDEADGIIHLVNKSLQTTRRFDALKLFISMRVLGEDAFAELIDGTFALAEAAARKIAADAQFELLNPCPELNAIVFRRLAGDDDRENDELNRYIHRELFQTGRAVIAKTSAGGKTYLKFTLLNPRTALSDIEEVLCEIQKLASFYLNSRRVIR
ncbi:aspartate aminotransferase family protein [Bacillus sonorensis]|uniref:pyridoxal phosphate-dependent decarboxylase family protein n=1 Tax=Bacillus sonorensis TaxID=119858 RepID=UPI000497262A|nr:aspartate aminotransferase family protein [Bacillus sonorensis]MBG9916641.1 2,4-diaminobutyrate decarboxylase [Bacillus sonorensis]MCF7619402.1 aspartate aminotransferase family protein [Bacillus sonorensis]MCY7855765.1 aspartate aminotransferase family protein [Bacillus sonorensis]MCY8025403.1 aspartate aminotransferase family protein [Bacillus sonorensis]MCY8032640.1 aspartate aminotransferase family protein [Bacillus sonorensis]